MKRHILFSILSLAFAAIIMSCDSESITPYTTTSPPRVYSLEITPNDSIEAGDTLALVCNADDGDGDDEQDTLRFDWYSPYGGLINIVNDTLVVQTDYLPDAGNRALWKADTTTGSFPIRVTVTDTWHSTVYNDTIYVVPDGAFTPPPVIERIITHSDTLEPLDTLRLSCEATSVDTTAILEYDWSSDVGRFISNTGSSVSWIAPNSIGTFSIKVTVSDPFHSSTDSTSTIVAPPGTFNHGPYIRSVTAAPTEVSLTDRTILRCDAVDRDGDFMTYSWVAPYGVILPQGPQPWNVVEWWAPSTPGEYTIQVVVSDGVLLAQSEVVVTVTQSYNYDFATDQVTNQWEYVGLLAGLGDADGFHSIEWDEENEVMGVIARSTYGSHGFKMTTQGFNHGEFSINVLATSTRFGNIGFVPKFIDERNYIMCGLNFNLGFYQIYSCTDGQSQWLADGWQVGGLSAGRFYTIGYTQTEDGTAEFTLEGESLWSGSIPDRFRNPVPLGVVVYGLDDSNAAWFDDLNVRTQ